MTKEKLPELGKIDPVFFDRVIYPRLGAPAQEMLIGPCHGVDYGVIRIGGQCLALSTDPFFIVPAFGFAKAAWFAFHIIMSDVAVSGLIPRYLAVDLNLPPEIKEEEMEALWHSVHIEAEKYGVTIVTGHTARYAGCNYPMVGGATALAVGPEKELRGPQLVKPGDKIVITKGPAVETVGLLAVLFPQKFIQVGGEKFQQEAAAVFGQMSVMDDCAIARRFPGIRMMHDATECGIWGGLYEMARAGKYGFLVEQDKIVTQPVIIDACRHLGIDPYSAISEGTLIAVVDPGEAEQLVAEFKKNNIISSVVGKILPAEAGLKIIAGSKVTELEHPKVDPYWQAVERLSREV